MKRLFKRFSYVIVLLMMVLALSQVASAKSVTVTSKYKSQVTKMLRHFDGILGYSCLDGESWHPVWVFFMKQPCFLD